MPAQSSDRGCYDQACNPATGSCENTPYDGDGSACGPLTQGDGKICCSGDCIVSDETNCGACGNICTSDFACIGKTCQCDEDCGDGKVCCAGVCQECCSGNFTACPVASSACTSVVCDAGVCGKEAKADFDACNTVGICHDGVCCGCIIAGVCYADGALKPANPCEVYRPKILLEPFRVTDNTIWSPKFCEGTNDQCSGPVCNPSTGVCETRPWNEGLTCSGLGLSDCRDTSGTCQNVQCLGQSIVNGTSCVAEEAVCSSSNGAFQGGQCVATPDK